MEQFYSTEYHSPGVRVDIGDTADEVIKFAHEIAAIVEEGPGEEAIVIFLPNRWPELYTEDALRRTLTKGLQRETEFEPRCRTMTREHAEFFVWVALTAFVDTVTSTFEGRWLHREKDGAFQLNRRDLQKNGVNERTFVHAQLLNLGWQLATFVAQTTGDGAAPSDVMEYCKLHTVLERWAIKWIDGKIGIVANPDDNTLGQEQRPPIHELVYKWLDQAFRPGELL